MRIVALDDERLALEALVSAIREVEPQAEIFPFMEASKAYEFIKQNKVEIAFLDIEIPETNGITLAHQIKAISPNTNIIFETGYASYANEAFRLHASGYLLKPITAEDVKHELSELRFPLSSTNRQKVFIQTFGNFEVFKDGKPIDMNARAKEILAYLVDRNGASVSNNEMYTILYEGRMGHEENFKKVKKNLIESLKAIGEEDILIQQWGRLALNTSMVECDLFEYRKGLPAALNQYSGEYMSQYSWAEMSVLGE